MQIYLVGGAVRDQLLNLPCKDKDWVVTGATQADMLNQGFQQVGSDFPVFLHPDSQEEYALARTERKSGHGYQGFSFDASHTVTLEEDLSRRDLTINAMAMDDQGQLIDPYGGSQDLTDRVLRHVSPAFTEDPLRVLRVARFAARFSTLGFTVASETLALMSAIVESGELQYLSAERVWQETQRALSEQSPRVYFELLRETGALKALFPEIDALFGVPQPEKHHPEIDTGLHTMLTLERAGELTSDTIARFAALTHDLGKAKTDPANWPSHYSHEKLGLAEIKRLCKRIKVPNDYRNTALITCEFHTHIHKGFELKPATVLKVLKRCDGFRRPERFQQMLLAAKADSRGRTGYETVPYEQAEYFARALDLCAGISAKDVDTNGLSGKEIGEKIDALREIKITELKRLYADKAGTR